MPKISIIGAGRVGSHVALILAEKKLAEIVLLDIKEDHAKGQALDIRHALSLMHSQISIVGTSNYAMTSNSDIVIITAGKPRTPGMTRDDLFECNQRIMRTVLPRILRYSPKAILVVVSNPVDLMSYLAYRLSKLSKQKVIGMSGILDTIRLKAHIAELLQIPADHVETIILGSHGDTMVPLISQTKVDGEPLAELMAADRIKKLIDRVKGSGQELVNLLRTGSAYFAAAYSITEMVDAILTDSKVILPCSAFLDGEYGFTNLFLGVPVQLGSTGIEKIVEMQLSDDEQVALRDSATTMKKRIKQLFQNSKYE
ncbi:MAG: malate dehydrogenase [Patescibacteria group bacterium]